MHENAVHENAVHENSVHELLSSRRRPTGFRTKTHLSEHSRWPLNDV